MVQSTYTVAANGRDSDGLALTFDGVLTVQHQRLQLGATHQLGDALGIQPFKLQSLLHYRAADYVGSRRLPDRLSSSR